jgi:poly-gamma-glutamate capsule biosynthesis protein CapA/YwtB (metallophosphatase superfamily)
VSTVRVIAAGDAIVTHRISANPDRGLADLVQLLRTTDVAITNVEMVFPGRGRRPSTTMHGTPLGVEPELLSEFEWLGIDVYGMANNHATDYGTDGLVASIEELERRNLPYAGVGRTLREARAPRYFDAPGGRVAFLAAGSSNARLSAAADPGIADAGRPGIAPVRLQKTHYIRRDRFDDLRAILAEAGVDIIAAGTTAPGIHFPYPDRNVWDPPPPGGIAVEGVHFVADDRPRVQTDALAADVDALVSVVGEARRQADVVIVGLHCHEGIQGRWNNEEPAEFLQPLAHRLIDAGADGIVGHGPHMLRGVELYKGRPICYSLGNFVFNLETIAAFPIEVYEQQGMPPGSTTADLYDLITGYATQSKFWESVVARFGYSDGALISTELHPITLGQGRPRSTRGWPQLADGDDGRRILEHLRELSAPFGSTVEIERVGDRYVGRITAIE